MVGKNLDSYLLKILRCPLHPDAGPLKILTINGRPPTSDENYESGLKCQQCDRVYPIIHGVPDMLIQNGYGGSFLEAETKQWDQQAPIYDEKHMRDAIFMVGIDATVRFPKREK